MPLVGAADHGQHLAPAARAGPPSPLRRARRRRRAGSATVGSVARRGSRYGSAPGQQAGQQLADARGLLRLGARAIALGREPHRVERDDADDHDGSRGRGRRQRATVAPDELGGAVAERVGARADRLVVEVAPQVVGELGDRRVAFGRDRFFSALATIVSRSPRSARRRRSASWIAPARVGARRVVRR